MSTWKIRITLLILLVISFLLSAATMLHLQNADVEAQTCLDVPNITVEWWQRTFQNNSGSTALLIGSTSRRFCSLAGVEVEMVNAHGEKAMCIVDTVGTDWRLRADISGGVPAHDADVACLARCFSW